VIHDGLQGGDLAIQVRRYEGADRANLDRTLKLYISILSDLFTGPSQFLFKIAQTFGGFAQIWR
jgi:hypothetical protein